MGFSHTDLAVLSQPLPEIHGGWWAIQPRAGGASALITEAVDDELAVLAFGATFGGQRSTSLASAVSRAWRDEGPAVVRALDACFGALLIDRRQKTVYLLSDSIGRRALRYKLLSDSILVSTHDLPIVASGICPPDFDPVSAVSLLSFGWCIGPTSLVLGIQPCDPNEYVRWSNGEIERVWDPTILTGGRLDQRDSRGRIARVDEMIQLARRNTRVFIRERPSVEVDLTAGLDSRCALALALSVSQEASLTAVTAGAHSTDVRVARLLARLYRIRHRTSVPDIRDTDSFLANLSLWAYAMNGMANGKRAVDSRLIVTGRSPTISGTGGEAYRGFYYGDYSDHELRQRKPRTAAKALLDRFLRPSAIRWLDAGAVDELRESHFVHFQRLTRISPVVSDLLDLFYALERLGRWAMDARCFWLAPTFAPFESPRLLRLGFQLPPPMSNHLTLPKSVLRRHARLAFYVPVNARYLLPFAQHRKGQSRVDRLVRSSLAFADKVSDRVVRVVSSEPVADHDLIRSQLFRSLLSGGLRDFVTEEGSVALQIADRNRLATMIQEHIDGREDHLEIIGLLATLERYRRLLGEAAGIARQVRG